MLSLSFEPVALLLDKLLPLSISTLLSKLDEVVPESVPVDGLGSYIHTSLQLIES